MKTRKLIVKIISAAVVLSLLAFTANYFYAGTPALCYSDGIELEEYTLDQSVKSRIYEGLNPARKIFGFREMTTLNSSLQEKANVLTDDNSAVVVLDKNGNISAFSGKADLLLNPVEIGNAFSPVVFAAVCEKNPDALKEDLVYTCNGSLKIKDYVLKCGVEYGHGDISFVDDNGFNDYFSCLCAQVRLSKRCLSNDSLEEYCKDIGIFGGVDLNGLNVNGGKMISGEFNCMGLNLEMSLIQLCRYYSAICNQGKAPEVRILPSSDEKSYSVLMSPETADKITHSYLNYRCSKCLSSECNNGIANFAETNNSSIAVISAEGYTVVYYIDSGNLKSDAMDKCCEMMDCCLN